MKKITTNTFNTYQNNKINIKCINLWIIDNLNYFGKGMKLLLIKKYTKYQQIIKIKYKFYNNYKSITFFFIQNTNPAQYFMKYFM